VLRCSVAAVALSLAATAACDGAEPRPTVPRDQAGRRSTAAADPPFGGLAVRWVGDPTGAGPVVVLLHGYGAPGDDLLPLARSIDAPEGTRFLLPEGPLSAGLAGRAWWPLDADRLRRRAGDPDEAVRHVPEGLADARARLRSLVSDLDRRGVPARRTVLAGFSQGAMLATDVALHAEDDYAGVVALSGGLAASEIWDPRMRARARTPFFLSHGRADPLLPFYMGERLRDRLAAAGVPVELVAFDGGHEIPPDVVDRLGAFLHRVL
jgi:phospholipase/carboxylesterase